MNIPTLTNVKYIEPSGYLTSHMQMYHDDLNQTLRKGLSDNGWTLPNQTQANITALLPSMPNGTLWYDSENDEVVVKVNGALRKITTTSYP